MSSIIILAIGHNCNWPSSLPVGGAFAKSWQEITLPYNKEAGCSTQLCGGTAGCGGTAEWLREERGVSLTVLKWR